jgi:hypothetical protein
METELLKIHCFGICRQSLPHNIPFNLIKKEWFIRWCVKDLNIRGRCCETYVYDYHRDLYGTLFFLWREIIACQILTNHAMLINLQIMGNSISGLIDQLIVTKNYELMNKIIKKIASNGEYYINEEFGKYFKYMSDENLRLAKNCWGEKEIIIGSANRIFGEKMIETLNKLIDVVGIKPEKLVKILYKQPFYKLKIKWNFRGTRNYINKFEEYMRSEYNIIF